MKHYANSASNGQQVMLKLLRIVSMSHPSMVTSLAVCMCSSMHLQYRSPSIAWSMHEYLMQGAVPFAVALEPGANSTPSDVHRSSMQDLIQEGKVSCQKYAYLYQ